MSYKSYVNYSSSAELGRKLGGTEPKGILLNILSMEYMFFDCDAKLIRIKRIIDYIWVGFHGNAEWKRFMALFKVVGKEHFELRA